MPQFVIIGWDGFDGAAQRDQRRERHIAYVEALYRNGRIVLAGPIRNDADDDSVGVVIIVEAADLDEARGIADGDPYVTGGVFETITVSPFKQVFPEKP